MMMEERTADDERILANVRGMYRRLVEMNLINAQDGRLLVLVNELCDTQSTLGKLFDEITFEVVVRKGKIFTQLNYLRPKLLSWYKCMHEWKQATANSGVNPFRSLSMERYGMSPYTVWLSGLEKYFASEIVEKLSRISGGIKLFFTRNSVQSGIHRHLSDRENFKNICEEMELELNSELCQSPLMSDALRIIGQFARVLQLASRLKQYFEPGERSLSQQDGRGGAGGKSSNYGPSASRSHGGGGGSGGDKVKMYQLSESYLWLSICIVLSIGSLFQSDAISIKAHRHHLLHSSTPSTSIANTCLPVDELSDAIGALKLLISSQFQLGNALQLLTLRYYKVSCLGVFSAQRKRAEVERARMSRAAPRDDDSDNLNDASNRSKEKNIREQKALTCQQFLSDPLCQLVTVEMPAFVKEKLRLSSAHELNEKNLMKTIFVLLMYCDTLEESTTTPTASSAPEEAAAVSATAAGAASRVTAASAPLPALNASLKRSFLCTALTEILRPMVQQLLPLRPAVLPDDAEHRGMTHQSNRDGKSQVQLPTREEMLKSLSGPQYEALLALREVANVQASISITTIRHIQYWSTLGLGPAPNENLCVGEKCFLHAMDKVLGDYFEQVGQCVTAAAAQDKDKVHLQFLEFLVRNEVAFELLCGTGPEFVYQAIRRTYGLRVRASFGTYCSPLVLTNAFHQYLLVAEKLERARHKKGTTQEFELRDAMDLFSAIRVMNYLDSKNVEDLYAECCRLRLLYVKKLGSDDKGELKRACELAVVSYWESLCQADDSKHTFELVRGMCEDLHPFEVRAVEPGGAGGATAATGCQVVAYVLNWRKWDMPPFADLFSPAAEHLRHATPELPPGCIPSQDAPLPVTPTIARAIELVENAHSRANRSEVLRWTIYSQYCRFSLKYPKMSTPVVIHGTLLLHQLMVAISQYGRDGVHTAVLAKRADLEVSKVVQILKPGEKTSLIVYSGPEKSVVALHMDLTALPDKVKLPLVFIPSCSFVSASDAQRREIENVEKLKKRLSWSIMKIMKSKRAMKHESLTNEVRKELARSGNGNTVWEDRLFKQALGDLIEKKFIERSPEDHSTYVYKT